MSTTIIVGKISIENNMLKEYLNDYSKKNNELSPYYRVYKNQESVYFIDSHVGTTSLYGSLINIKSQVLETPIKEIDVEIYIGKTLLSEEVVKTCVQEVFEELIENNQIALNIYEMQTTKLGITHLQQIVKPKTFDEFVYLFNPDNTNTFISLYKRYAKISSEEELEDLFVRAKVLYNFKWKINKRPKEHIDLDAIIQLCIVGNLKFYQIVKLMAITKHNLNPYDKREKAIIDYLYNKKTNRIDDYHKFLLSKNVIGAYDFKDKKEEYKI